MKEPQPPKPSAERLARKLWDTCYKNMHFSSAYNISEDPVVIIEAHEAEIRNAALEEIKIIISGIANDLADYNVEPYYTLKDVEKQIEALKSKVK